MKIGIITQYLCTNYGGILQNYALQQILKERGHNVETLQHDSILQLKFPRNILVVIERCILKQLGKYKGPVFYEKKYNKDFPVVTKNTLGFVASHIKTRVVNKSCSDVQPDEYDALVVGSDQVWRKNYNNLNVTFLLFAKNWGVKKVAYAASFGVDKWEYNNEETTVISESLRGFNAISVRELSAIDMCKEYIGVYPELVLDPTLLLTFKDYNRLLAGEAIKENYLFYHFLDPTQEKISFIEQISELKKWELLSLNHKCDEHQLLTNIEDRIQPPVEDWLRGIRDSKIVITDSFHAAVFSIIFSKPFYIVGNAKRGNSRFESLLSAVGIQGRMIDIKSFDMANIDTKINYDAVNIRLEELRKKSLSFLYKYF